MSVRKAGRRKAGTNGGIWGNGPQIYEYSSPKVTFDSDNLSDEEIAKLSGDVKTYQREVKTDENPNSQPNENTDV